jgi:hypothetical protein
MVMEQLLMLLKPLIEMYAGELGILVQIISIVGTLRIFIKPLMSVLEAYVLFTPKESDNAKLEEFKNGKIYKGLVYVLDWFGSIKIKK